MKITEKLRERLNGFRVHDEKLNRSQLVLLIVSAVVAVAVKILLIKYNMFGQGEPATRTWNALWWAQDPFFVKPISGNPGWFYFMGPILMITKEVFYTPIIITILAVTLSGIYIFKITLLLSDYKTSILAFFIFTLNPVVFRHSFEPMPQPFYITSICIMAYYFIRAAGSKDEKQSAKYFKISGIFSFIGLMFRPEAVFVIVSFAFLAFLTGKKGRASYIIISLMFQVIWLTYSHFWHGSLLKYFETVREFDLNPESNIINAGMLIRLRGLFLPYYFMVVGITFIMFYFFLRGVYISFKKYPLLILGIIFIPIIVPALVNGVVALTSLLYHSTRYIYPVFYFSSILSAIGLSRFLERYKNMKVRVIIAALIVATCIPLSYIKDFVPRKYNKLFPKIIQFTITAEDPDDSRTMIRFIDSQISGFPALIFDFSKSDPSVFYIPYRTKLAPPDKILISEYNVPKDKPGLENEVKHFMSNNPKGIIMVKKEKTVLSEIFNNGPWLAENNIKLMFGVQTGKWVIYTYEKN